MLFNTDNITVGSRGGVGCCLILQVNCLWQKEQNGPWKRWCTQHDAHSLPRRHSGKWEENIIQKAYCNKGSKIEILESDGIMHKIKGFCKEIRLLWHPGPNTSSVLRLTGILKERHALYMRKKIRRCVKITSQNYSKMVFQGHSYREHPFWICVCRLDMIHRSLPIYRSLRPLSA